MSVVTEELDKLFPPGRAREFGRGSTGLYHLFRSIAEVRGHGDVVVPNLCCETVALAAQYAGHAVRFAEIDGERFCVTAETVREALSPLTKAVVVVHLFGLVVDYDVFRELRIERPDLIFVEDVAHAVGGRNLRGEEVGTGFDHSMFSFSSSKILRGDGGAIVSYRNDDVSAHFHTSSATQFDETPDPLLALSLRNLVHALADLHRASSENAGREIAPALWERYRPLIAFDRSICDPALAVADLCDRESIRDRRYNRVGRYREAICNSDFSIPEFLPSETCWRLPLLAGSPTLRRRATEALRQQGLHASNHYFPLNRLLPSDPLPISESVGDRIINLWVDDSTDDGDILAAARILNTI